MIGETIGNFRLVSRLGRGGMGEVWLGEQQSVGTRVAIKLLHADITDESERQRFFNEARAVSRIQHAGIVKIFDVGVASSGHAYLVMEYLEGESLARRLRDGRLAPVVVAELGRQIASVLSATHNAGITHRDLKPDNLFIIPDRELASRQRVKVLDFGVAKLGGTLAAVSPRTQGTMGTPMYMAPEQWGDPSKVDLRADIYSLGCVLFEMTCGRMPFQVTTIAEAYTKHSMEVPVLARTLAPDCPPALETLLAHMLAKQPDHRPQTMDDVVARFDQLIAQVGPYTPTSAQLPPSSSVPAGITLTTDAPRRGLPPVPHAPPTLPVRRSTTAVKVIGAVVLVGGAAALSAVLLARGSAAPAAKSVLPSAAAGSFACALAAPTPTIDGTSSEPIALSYDFRVIEKTELETRIETSSRVVSPAGTTQRTTSLRLPGAFTWSTELSGQMSSQLAFSKFSVDRTTEVTGTDARRESIHWRSDDTSTDAGKPDLANLRKAVGTPLVFTLDHRGKLTADEAFRDHVRSLPVGDEWAAMFNRGDLFLAPFPRITTEPVAVGAIIPSSELLRPLPSGYGELSGTLALRVAAISKDRTRVLLLVEPTVDVGFSGNVEVTEAHTSVVGWYLWHVTRGEIAKSSLRACTHHAFKLDGAAMTATSQITWAYDSQTFSFAVQTPPIGQ